MDGVQYCVALIVVVGVLAPLAALFLAGSIWGIVCIVKETIKELRNR